MIMIATGLEMILIIVNMIVMVLRMTKKLIMIRMKITLKNNAILCIVFLFTHSQVH